MATELASGFVSLTVRYKDAMKQINKDFAKVASTAGQSGTKAGQQFSQGVQRQTRNIAHNVGFGQVAGKATAAGRQAGGAFSTGFLSGTKGLSAKVSQSVQQVASPRQMQASGSTAGTGFMAGLAGGMLKGGAIGLVTTAIAGIGTAVTLGMGRLSSIDDAKFKLQALGNSAESVKVIMDNALASVKGTAFGLGDAATAAATAVAAGVKPGEQLTKYLKGIADAAAIAGVPLGDMAAIFNKVQTNGVAMTDDLQQIADRGIPIFTKLAEHFHVSGEELNKMVEDGKVSAADFQQVMAGTVGGAAVKMGDSVSGGFANVKAAIARFGAGLLEPLFKQLPGLFAKLTPMIDQLTAAIGPTLASLGTQIGPVLTQLGQLFNEHLLPAIKEVWAQVKGPLAEAFTTAKAAFTEALPIFKAVAVVIGVALVAGIKAAGFVWPIMINALTTAMNTFRAFAAVVTGAWDLVSGAFTTGWDIISGVFDKMKSGFQTIADFMKTVFTGVSTVVKALFSGIVETIKEPLRAVGRILQGLPVIDAGPIHLDVTGFGDKLAGLRKGGTVRGRGGTDNVLAWLTAGEGVVTKSAMQGGGAAVVAALNARGGLPGFAEGLNPGADYLRSQIMKMWPQIKTIGGKRADRLPEHPSGNAIDIMIPGWDTPQGKALGDQVAAFVARNADALGLTHFIWQQRIFYPGDTTGDMMGDKGSPTQNHMDHVHVWLQKGGGKLPTAPLIGGSKGGLTPGGGGAGGGGGGTVGDAMDNAAAGAVDEVASEVSDNPYAKLVEAIKGILPDFGQLADIGAGGLKENLLPGLSDPTEWPNIKSGAALLNSIGILSGNKQIAGIMGIASAAMGGSGSGVVSGIQSMIPAPFGTAEPAAIAPGQIPAMAPMGALVGAPGAAPVGAGLTVDNSVNFNGQINDDAAKVIQAGKRQQQANNFPHLGTRRFV